MVGKISKRRFAASDADIYVFIAIPFIVYLIFFIIPNVNALIFSLFRWNGISPEMDFAGFKNYVNLFQDGVFWLSLKNTLVYTITLILGQNIIALILAVLIYKTCRIHNFFRMVYFLPAIFSTVTIGIIWGFIYDPNIGALNGFLNAVGLEKLARAWLAEPGIVVVALACVHIWVGIGYGLILFITGLQNIPDELYESAGIDGVNAWQKFYYITFPQLMPATVIVLVLTTIGGFRSFDYVYVMTGGGATHSSEVMATLLFKEGLEYSRVGYSASISVMLLIIVTGISILQLRIFKEK